MEFRESDYKVVCITMILMSLYEGCSEIVHFLDKHHTFVSAAYYYEYAASGILL